MTRFASTIDRVDGQRRWSSAAWIRVALTAGLWCLAAPPFVVMGKTAANFDEIFRELGLRPGPLQMTLLGIGRLLESPALMLGVLAMLAAFCFAAALSCIPIGTVAPADGPGPRPRWALAVAAAAAIAFLSLALTVAYMGSMLGMVQSAIGKLDGSSKTPVTQPAPR